tara:strand:- start:56 stop:442 length:387 start_codon:yes stop_codon:yes gene_type:complete
MDVINTTVYQLVINTKDYRGFNQTNSKQNLLFSSAVALLTELNKWNFIRDIKDKTSILTSKDIVALKSNKSIVFKTKDDLFTCSVHIIKRTLSIEKGLKCTKGNFIKFFNRHSIHDSLFDPHPLLERS